YDVMALLVFLELGVARDGDAVGGFMHAPADVEDVVVLVLQLFRRTVFPIPLAAENEDFARPRTGDDVLDPVAVQGHELCTETDASARGPPAVGFALLEFHPGRVRGLGVRADVLVEP